MGNVAEWVGALGTTGAFIAALLLLRKELEDHRQRREGEKREAAEKVSAWWEYDRSQEGKPAPTWGQKSVKSYFTAFWALRARNAGSEPIYNCTVFIGPRIDDEKLPEEYFFPIIPPDTTFSELLDDTEIVLWHDEKKGILSKGVWVELTFRDPEGRNWLRGADGRLFEILKLPEGAEERYQNSRKPDS